MVKLRTCTLSTWIFWISLARKKKWQVTVTDKYRLAEGNKMTRDYTSIITGRGDNKGPHLNNRLVVDIEFESTTGYREDIYITSAIFDDTGVPLTEDEILKLEEDYPELLDQRHEEMLIAAADHAYDASRGFD